MAIIIENKTESDKIKVEKLKNQVMSLVMLKGYSSLVKACKDQKTDYQVIYGQLNGYRRCYVKPTIENFVKKLDPKKRIELQGDGTPQITFI